MEQLEVSINQVRVYHHLKTLNTWQTNKEISAALGMSLRNASLHTHRLVGMGICDQVEVFPGHRYRLSDKASKRNLAYLRRLEQAMEVFAGQL
jgi:DNA-binding transcriptional ArsR family regulator